MKVWVLFDDPYDEGWNVYGIFSSKEKLDIALELFSSKSNQELTWASFELDDLERFFEKAKQPSRWYTGYSPLPYSYGDDLSYLDMHISPSGLDSFISDRDKKDTLLLSNSLWLSVYAKSQEDAETKARMMLKEITKQTPDELGWKYLEMENDNEKD